MILDSRIFLFPINARPTVFKRKIIVELLYKKLLLGIELVVKIFIELHVVKNYCIVVVKKTVAIVLSVHPSGKQLLHFRACSYEVSWPG